jgi:OOP family OmpA-OmpF porin
MKKIIISASLLLAGFTFAQDSTYNKQSIDFGVGVANIMTPGNTPGYKTNIAPISFNLGYRKMLNRQFGLSANLGYNRFSFSSKKLDVSSNLVTVSLNGVLNLRNLFDFNDFSGKIGLLAHLGGGGSLNMSFPATGFRKETAIFGSLGFTPQYKLNDKLALFVDATLYIQKLQDLTMDMRSVTKDIGIGKLYATGLVGVNYYAFGSDKDKSHADWAMKVDKTKSELDALKAKVNNLENKLVDTDKDGVADYLDLEPNTPEGSMVNTHGQKVVDTDGDGIVDSEDYCPTVKGTAEFKGCPTAVGGETTSTVVEGKEVEGELKLKISKNTSDVTFDTKSTAVKTNFKAQLQALAKTLNENPSLVVTLNGHCDNVGEDILNNKLSIDRANAAKDFLVSKGVSASRIKTVGHGTSQPKMSNDTEKGRAANRRVEIVVRTK